MLLPAEQPLAPHPPSTPAVQVGADYGNVPEQGDTATNRSASSLCVPAHSRVMTYREHTAWVVKAHLQKRPEGHIVSVR